jgi:hypothetical protein
MFDWQPVADRSTNMIILHAMEYGIHKCLPLNALRVEWLARREVRRFDQTTIRIGRLAILAQFPTSVTSVRCFLLASFSHRSHGCPPKTFHRDNGGSSRGWIPDQCRDSEREFVRLKFRSGGKKHLYVRNLFACSSLRTNNNIGTPAAIR